MPNNSKRSALERAIFKMGQSVSRAVGASTGATRTADAEKRPRKRRKKYGRNKT